MTENHTPNAPADAQSSEDEVTQSRWSTFAVKHPYAHKAALIVLGVGAAGGAVLGVKTLKANRSHLASAGNNVQEALGDLSAAVTPSGPDA